MSSSIVCLLRSHRSRFLDRLLLRILELLPQYRHTCLSELRSNVEGFFDDLLEAIQVQDAGKVIERAIAVSQKRATQGFLVCEIVRAGLLSLPTIREVARELGDGAVRVVEQSWEEVERVLSQLAASMANGYLEAVSRELTSQNQNLDRQNQHLRRQEQILSLEASQVLEALNAAKDLNRCVIESLTAGVIAIDRRTQTVTLYSSQMEAILGIPKESVLHRPMTDAFAGIGGLDLEVLMAKVCLNGRLPRTKRILTLPNGKHRLVYLRAQRLRNAKGEAQGTVVVVDDDTERELLIDSFSRYVSWDVVEQLRVSSQPVYLGGERRTCTLLFADIRGFTRLSERLPLEQLHELLNAYFRVTGDAIRSCGGFIDKFMGDKVMAIFKQQSTPAGTAAAALGAALTIQRNIRQLNQERRNRGEETIQVGIGINTGKVFIGNIGSDERMDFTAIGDVVNVADRLQHAAHLGEVLLSKDTAELMGDRFPLVERADIKKLPGRTAPVRVFELPLLDDPVRNPESPDPEAGKDDTPKVKPSS